MIYSLVIYDNDLNVTDVISFSAVTSASESYKAQTTDNVVEYGFVISDHIITQSPEISLEVILSAYSIFSDSLLLEWDGERFVTANAKSGQSTEDEHYIMKQKLIDIVKKRQLFTLVVSKRDSYIAGFKEKSEDLMGSLITKFPNCVITSLDFDSKSNSASAVFAKLNIKQIRIAVTEQFKVDPSTVKWVQKKTVASSTTMSEASKNSGGVSAETGELVAGSDTAPTMGDIAKNTKAASAATKAASRANAAKIAGGMADLTRETIDIGSVASRSGVDVIDDVKSISHRIAEMGQLIGKKE